MDLKSLGPSFSLPHLKSGIWGLPIAWNVRPVSCRRLDGTNRKPFLCAVLRQCYLRVNATYTPPEGFLLDCPPPAAITTYCLPSIM